VRSWLVDTGPLVAYLDAADPAHSAVADRLDGFTGSLSTTSAVVTEAMHFAAAVRGAPRRLAELLDRGGIAVFDACQPPSVAEAAGLMEKYADTPMDFADATLVLLAETLGQSLVLTLDRRGFATYRTRRGRPFRLVLDERS
jgi:predicted nucleic acid-binding protein